MGKNAKIAYAEVMEVLKYFDREYVMKIPIEVLEYFKLHSKKDVTINIDKDDIFNKNNISEDALAILAYLDLKYWATEEEKKELLKVYRNNELKEDEEKKKLYNSNMFEKNDLTNIERGNEQKRAEDGEGNDNHNLPVKNKEFFLKRIINRIISFFKSR